MAISAPYNFTCKSSYRGPEISPVTGCKRQNIINLVLFGNPIEIDIILISDNSGTSGSSG